MKTAPKRGAGRKPKDGADSLAAIREKATDVGKYIKLGMTMTDSARAAGVNPRTLYSWLEKAKNGVAGYDEIADVLENRRAEGQAALVQRIDKASDKDWKAAAWILERRHNTEWGNKNSVNLTGNLGLQVGQMSEEELESAIAEAEKKRQLEGHGTGGSE